MNISQKVATRIFSGNLKRHLASVVFVALGLSITLSLGACSADKEEPVAPTNTAKPATPSPTNAATVDGKITPVGATASSSSPTDPPRLAFDNELTTVWNAAGVAPSWIQLDLGQPMSISKVRLNVSQSPPGQTTHNISGGPAPESLTPIGTLDGKTTDGQWLELAKPATNVRYLKIETVKSPSWVSWREIEILK